MGVVDKILHHLATTDQSCGGRYPGIGTGDRMALGAGPHVLGRTDTVVPATDIGLVDTLYRELGRIDYLEMLDVRLPQFLTDHLCQRIVDGLPDIRDLQLRGIELIGGAHTRDDGDVELMATLDKVELGRDRVDTVYHIVVVGKIELISVGGEIERLIFPHMAPRIDVVDTVFRHIHLVPPYAGDSSEDLAVDIRQADTVVVYDIYGSHTAAGQYLNDIAPKTATREPLSVSIAGLPNNNCVREN